MTFIEILKPYEEQLNRAIKGRWIKAQTKSEQQAIDEAAKIAKIPDWNHRCSACIIHTYQLLGKIYFEQVNKAADEVSEVSDKATKPTKRTRKAKK